MSDTRLPSTRCSCPRDPFGQATWFEYWDGVARAEKAVDCECPVHGDNRPQATLCGPLW